MKVTVSPNAELVAEIRAKIKENNGHCACVVNFNNDTKCMCKEFREQISRGEEGECHCGLYIATN
jgi:ferredoxin-thioredoxin reductase catalytic subunit